MDTELLDTIFKAASSAHAPLLIIVILIANSAAKTAKKAVKMLEEIRDANVAQTSAMEKLEIKIDDLPSKIIAAGGLHR